MEKLETYYIGMDEEEASWMGEIVELNRSKILITKLLDQKIRDFIEVFGQGEEIRA